MVPPPRLGLQGNARCGFTSDAGAEGFDKPGQIPDPNGEAADITIAFSDVNLVGPVAVYDIWGGVSLGTFTDSYTAKQVPYHGTAFLKLAAVA